MREAYCQDIVPTVAQALRDIAELLESKALLLPYSKFDARAANLRARAEWLESGCLRLVVVGMVSRGKSTLINALLGEERLVVDDQSSTGVISEIVYGKNTEEVTIVKKNGEKCAVPNDDFKEKYSLSEKEITSIQDSEHNKLPNRLMSIKQAVLEADYPLGRADGGLRIVDTLGLRAGEDAEGITEEFLDQADAVVVVIDNRGMLEGDDEKEFIKARLRLDDKRLEHIFFVINYFHSKPDWSEEQVEADMDKKKEEARGLLRDYYEQTDGELDRELFDRRVFVVNAYLALNAKVNEGGGAQLERLLAFERAIEQVMSEERVHLVLEATLSEFLIPALDDAHYNIDARGKALNSEIKDLEKMQRNVKAFLSELSKKALNIRESFEASTWEVAKKAGDSFKSEAERKMNNWPTSEESEEIEAVPAEVRYQTGFWSTSQELAFVFGKQIRERLDPLMNQVEKSIIEPGLEKRDREYKEGYDEFYKLLQEVEKERLGPNLPTFFDPEERHLRKSAEALDIPWDKRKEMAEGVLDHLKARGWKKKVGRAVGDFFLVGIPFLGRVIFKGARMVKAIHKNRDVLKKELDQAVDTMSKSLDNEIKVSGVRVIIKDFAALEMDIVQQRQQLDDVISQKRSKESEVPDKIAQLDKLEEDLNERCKQIDEAVFEVFKQYPSFNQKLRNRFRGERS
jgi:GTPase SAR1 family protein/nucleoid DNA-binding protein